ncbi:MAG: hypothetical protein ABSC93_03155, partial [Bryobacteraceae bacterium]
KGALGHQNPPESGIKQAKKILINRFIGRFRANDLLFHQRLRAAANFSSPWRDLKVPPAR